MSAQQMKGSPYDLPARAMAEARRDMRQRDIVNHAIDVQQSANTVSAIEYLKSHDIASGVIERILLEPGRRRPV